jgi:hypothetical protein
MLAQDPVLLEQVFDGVLLAAVHPAGDGEDEEVEWARVHRADLPSGCRHAVR